MEKLKVEPSSNEATKMEVMSKTQEVPPYSEMACSKKIKPRAIILKQTTKISIKLKSY
jgi:hypothetical protein